MSSNNVKVGKNKSDTRTRKRMWWITAAIALAVLIFFDFSPLGGNTRFYSKWVSCGQKPVTVAGSGFLNSGVPHYYDPSVLSAIRGQREYFCTALQAEQEGYSASPDRYEFPELDKNR